MEKRARRMMSAAVHTVYTNGILFRDAVNKRRISRKICRFLYVSEVRVNVLAKIP